MSVVALAGAATAATLMDSGGARPDASSPAAAAAPSITYLVRACATADATAEAVDLRRLRPNAAMRAALDGATTLTAGIDDGTRIRLAGSARRAARGRTAGRLADLSAGDRVVVAIRAPRGAPSAAQLSAATRIVDLGPARACSPLRILSPRGGRILRGVVPVRFAGAPPDARRPGWNTTRVRNGRHRVVLRVLRRGRPPLLASRVVRVANPPVAILAPAAGATVRGSVPWTIRAPAHTTLVTFRVDGRAVGVNRRRPWRFGRWNSRSVADGVHALAVTVRRSRTRARTVRIRVRVSNGIESVPGAPATPGPGAPAGPGFFSPTSIWNAPVPASAALDPRSDALVADLLRQVAWGPWINTDEYSTPIYTVPAGMRTVKIALTNSYRDPKVVAALAAVPIPPGARPSAGSDGHLVLWQPATDTMWEFFDLKGSGDSWSAGNAAKITRVSQSSGVNPLVTGATASGLALAGGVVTLDEWESGRIDHALALAIPEPRREWLSKPANRTDGWVNSANAIPEGAHFRLDPDLDIASLNLPRATRMLAEAAQTYGIVVRDKSGAVVFYGEDPTPTGADPYPGWFGPGGAGAVARAFPWDRLQLLKMDLRCCWQVP